MHVLLLEAAYIFFYTHSLL